MQRFPAPGRQGFDSKNSAAGRTWLNHRADLSRSSSEFATPEGQGLTPIVVEAAVTRSVAGWSAVLRGRRQPASEEARKVLSVCLEQGVQQRLGDPVLRRQRIRHQRLQRQV